MKARQQERNRLRGEIHDSAFGALIRLAELADDALKAGDEQKRIMLADVRPRAMKMYDALARATGMTTGDKAVEEEKEKRAETFIHDLEDLCTDCEKSYKIKIHRDFRPDVVELIPPIFLLPLMRILELQLHNVWDHAEATEVRITLQPDRPPGSRKKPRQIMFNISDNGKGCDFSWESLGPSQLGLVGARKRIERVGGSLEVYSTPCQGFTLFVTISLA